MKIRDFGLERFFSLHEFNTKHVLCQSDCETFTVKEILDMGKTYEADLKSLGLGYTESQGHPLLREEISKLYDSVSPEQIIVFSGAEEGIFVFMNSLLSSGDHVIIQYPAYQSLYEVAISIGAEVTKLNMNEGAGWDLDIRELEDSIRENTKLIVLNTPHNPTGHIIPDNVMKRIVDIARDNDLYIFSDEVYRFLNNGGDLWMSSSADLYEKCFSLGVMSKTFGLAGLRIGWLASKDNEMMEAIRSYKDYTSICNSAPSELLSIMALRNKETIIERNRGIIKENLSLFDSFMERHSDALDWVRPKGGSIGFPRLLNGVSSSNFAEELLMKKGVLISPSNLFDFGDEHFRVGFGKRNFPNGLVKLEEYMDESF